MSGENDSISAITRLIDIGVPRYMISSSIIGIMAQRLVRKICPKCKTKASIFEEGFKKLNIRADSFEGLDCQKPIHLDFVICPYCKYEVQRNCFSCHKPLQADWVICPYCKRETQQGL